MGITESRCKCGQPVLIEFPFASRTTRRADGKRIFYPDEPDGGWCAFRCKSCGEPVPQSVPGAEVGPISRGAYADD